MASSGGHSRAIGHGYGFTGKNGPLGSEYYMYPDYKTDDEKIEEEELDIDIDTYVEDDVRNLIRNTISPYDLSAYGVDNYRSDKGSLTSPNHAFMEGDSQKPWTHTTTARSTMSPFSHNQLYPNGMGPIIGTGGSDQAFRTTGNHMSTGTEKGWNKGHSPLTDIDDENLYDIRDILDPDERSFRKHQDNILEPVENSFKEYQKSLKHTLNKINEYLLDN